MLRFPCPVPWGTFRHPGPPAPRLARSAFTTPARSQARSQSWVTRDSAREYPERRTRCRSAWTRGPRKPRDSVCFTPGRLWSFVTQQFMTNTHRDRFTVVGAAALRGHSSGHHVQSGLVFLTVHFHVATEKALWDGDFKLDFPHLDTDRGFCDPAPPPRSGSQTSAGIRLTCAACQSRWLGPPPRFCLWRSGRV